MAKQKTEIKDGEINEKKVSSNEKTNESIPPKAQPQTEEQKKTNVRDVLKSIFDAFGENGTDDSKRKCPKIIRSYLKNKLGSHSVYQKYNVLILFDENSLVKADSDKIYNAVTNFSDKKPILLVLYSQGGSAASAYLIGKLCREYSEKEFHVAVPRFAKSAATMICCAANQIHMGSLSELGPIDPQINGLPALGLKNSVEHIAEMVKQHPESSTMFAEYLEKSLSLIYLGYYERVAESAQQYAEKLLSTHKVNLKRDESEIANELVYKYKDHGFVIDRAEAIEIFGEDIICSNTEEYEFSNLVYNELTMIANFSNWVNQTPYFIGSLDSEISFIKQKNE